MSVFLGIDVGTQSVKVVAYDAERRAVRQSVSAALDLIAREDGAREQLAQWWIEALRHCTRALDPVVRARVKGIAVSGQQHGLVALDDAGDVLCPVKLWCDTSTTSECEEITAAVGGVERCVALAGNPILPGYTASKVRGLRNTQPDTYARLRTILLPHDYLNFVLTGERFMECGDASGTGWMDVRSRTWSMPLLRAIDPQRDLLECLPPLVGAASECRISARAAADFDLPDSAMIAVGGGDNMMAAIGTGNVSAGRLTASLGTSGTLFAHADRPVIDGGDIAAFCSSADGWLPLICTMNCTVATEQVRKLGNITLADTEALLATTTPGAAGIVTLPFYNGERTPNLPRATASIFGIDVHNMSPANLLRSAMEGATFGLRYGLDAFAASGLRFDSVCVTGGGSTSATWRQMVADIFNLPVIVLRQQEGAALGAALQAAWSHQRAGGASQSLQSLVDTHLTIDSAASCTPTPGTAQRYDEVYASYLRHLATLQSGN
jgi:xylulokinase